MVTCHAGAAVQKLWVCRALPALEKVGVSSLAGRTVLITGPTR